MGTYVQCDCPRWHHPEPQGTTFTSGRPFLAQNRRTQLGAWATSQSFILHSALCYLAKASLPSEFLHLIWRWKHFSNTIQVCWGKELRGKRSFQKQKDTLNVYHTPRTPSEAETLERLRQPELETLSPRNKEGRWTVKGRTLLSSKNTEGLYIKQHKNFIKLALSASLFPICKI